MLQNCGKIAYKKLFYCFYPATLEVTICNCKHEPLNVVKNILVSVLETESSVGNYSEAKGLSTSQTSTSPTNTLRVGLLCSWLQSGWISYFISQISNEIFFLYEFRQCIYAFFIFCSTNKKNKSKRKISASIMDRKARNYTEWAY